MKIALLGHGNMGTEVESLISKSGSHQVVDLSEAEVVIDFTSPEVVLDNIKKVASLGKNMVVGTTGWYENLGEVEKIVEESGIGLIYGQNFSVGANTFFRIVSEAAKLFNQFKEYDAYGLEIHHKAKKDSPSGTALRIAKEVQGLQFNSIRSGRNPGFHQVVFDSPADSITLSHQAHNRSGFAQGAILAAEFIQGKKGIYTFEEVLK